MEILGQGFTLPLEDMDITSNDMNIYAQWLFDPHVRPAAVTKDGLEQELYQIIFHQYSLLFQPRIFPPPPPAPLPPSSSPRTGYNQYIATSGSASASAHSNSFHTTTLPVTQPMNLIPVFPAGGQEYYQHHRHHHHHHQQQNANTGSSSSGSQSPPPPPHPIGPSTTAATPNPTKESISQLAHRHIELCKKTLAVLARAGRVLALSEETWMVLLKVMLGITDFLLKEPMGGDTNGSGIPNMGDELCEHLLRVLCELWLRSQIKDVAMWNMLKDCFRRWTHRPKSIEQWTLISLSLTTRTLNVLYGDEEDTSVVMLSMNGTNVKMDLAADFVDYAWYRILHLIPHPLELPAHNFTLAMLGIGQLIDCFNAVDERVVSRTAEPPSGNTILHIFGTYLFDACSTAPQAEPESQRGCAEAFASLCKIFCRPQHQRPFLRTYIERFYAALSVGLKSDACLPVILLHSTELFATDLEGVRMLVSDFIAAIKLVLPKMVITTKGFVSVDDVRLAAIKVVSTIMCLPNLFEAVELKPGWDWDMQCASDSASVLGEPEHMVTQLIRVLYTDQPDESTERPFTGLKFYILELLLMSLRTESSSYNMRYLLHLINVYVIEDVPFCKGLVGTVVKLITEKILTMQLPSDVTLVAFDVLIDFVDLYEYVKRDSKNVARELVLALSRYVDALIGAGRLVYSYPLIVQAYDCMIRWILASQWIIDDHDCYKAVIATLSKGITIFDRASDDVQIANDTHSEKKKRRDATFPPTKQLFQLPPRSTSKNTTTSSGSALLQHSTVANAGRNSSTAYKKEEVAVRMAAEYCMSQFVNQLGQFPSLAEISSRQTGVNNDLQQLKHKRWRCQSNTTTESSDQWEPRDAIRYFLLDKRIILALYDVESTHQESRNAPAVQMILRDTTGKYVWSVESQYKAPTTSRTTTPSTTFHGDVTTSASDSSVLAGTAKSNEDIPPPNRTGSNDIPPTVVAVNADALPTFDNLFAEGSNSWKQWNVVRAMAEDEKQAEDTIRESAKQKAPTQYNVEPSKANISTESARGFRLLLADLGLLLPGNHSRITPLRITETLITEIETLDMLNDRDCVSVTAYYAESGDASWLELVESPPPINPHFFQFLNCLGWPIDIARHTGFKGKLDPAICETTSYYADRSVEFLVNVPYFLHQPPEDDGVWGTTNTISKIHRQVSSDDHVCIIWIENLAHYATLAKQIKQSNSAHSKSMVYLFINPLKNSASGLYWIRILIPPIGNQATSVTASQRLNENALIFGPLVDGIVISRHALGAMIRNTAISAHQACRVVTDTYTRPYVMRKQFIEEISHRHKEKLQLSE
ncbi:hypothetical protein BX666DRAFT_2017636 [Dichotomocladium elegans]|nr:hypothetical protein BX666DRAFT_2017636 [Dichotomocladium elegans]